MFGLTLLINKVKGKKRNKEKKKVFIYTCMQKENVYRGSLCVKDARKGILVLICCKNYIVHGLGIGQVLRGYCKLSV